MPHMFNRRGALGALGALGCGLAGGAWAQAYDALYARIIQETGVQLS